MSGTIDLGVVKLDTKRAEDNIKRLDENIHKLDNELASLDRKIAAAKENNAKWSTTFSHAGEAMDSLADSARNIGGGVAAAVVAVGAFAQQIATGAAAAERNAVALRGLGSNYQLVQQATAGAVTAQEAFAAQNRLTQSHLRVSGEQLASITRAAREFALRTGTDTTQALNQLTEALANGDQRALRPFGINVQVGTLRTQTFRQALGQLQTAQRGTAASAETLTEAQNRLGRAWDNFKNDAAAAAAETFKLKDAFTELADALESITEGGPLLHNFFSTVLEDITGIQHARTGTAEDRTRNDDQSRRETLLRAMSARQGELSFSGLQVNRLNGAEATRLTRALTNGNLSRDEAQAAVMRAAIASGFRDAQAAMQRSQPGRTTEAERRQNAADDQAEMTRDMSAQDQFQLAQDRREAREQLRTMISDLRSAGFRPRAQTIRRLERDVRNFLSPSARRDYQRLMSEYQRLLAREQRFRGLDPNAARMGLSDYDIGGGGRGEFDETFGVLGSAGRRTADGSQSIMERYGSGLSNDQYREILESERAKIGGQTEMDQRVGDMLKRNDLSVQVGSFFSDTQTLAEKGAKGFENAFNTMSGSVSSFIDTLIEGQVPAGEAAVGLAKAALKGLAMQAVPEALFETAKGFAALAMGDPRASIHFTAAGIYTAVGVAAGAAAAGISAAQRAGQAPSASASMSAGGFTSPGGSNASNERGSVVFNINSTVFDPERAEETVARLMAGANRRGL